MKGFVITMVALIGFFVWFKDWATSGKMDAFIAQHRHPTRTPALLNAIGEFYYICQEHKASAHYFKWLYDQYPRYPRMDRVHWRLGKCYEETGRRGEAIDHYKALKDTYTASEYHTMGENRYNSFKF